MLYSLEILVTVVIESMLFIISETPLFVISERSSEIFLSALSFTINIAARFPDIER